MTGFWPYAAASVMYALGTAPVFALTNEVIIASAPQERVGAAAGISETSAELGGALGMLALGAFAALRFGKLGCAAASAPVEEGSRP